MSTHTAPAHTPSVDPQGYEFRPTTRPLTRALTSPDFTSQGHTKA
ncbi:MAG: hypothetical protein [Siphoviridae sp. ct7UA22]|nr:MAG: hypothetical protein [Siphoviridae sp. ct7UA22]